MEVRSFEVQLQDWKEIHELPGGWPPDRLRALLESLEVEGVSDAELTDMVLMALQDLDPDEAADRILETVFGDSMRPGVRQNLAHDLTEERPWEEFADIGPQAEIFNAVVLLQQAFPREFDRPDAVRVQLRLQTDSQMARSWLAATPPDAALLLRILAAGMGDRAILRRLFSESLEADRFPEAGGILWRSGVQPAEPGFGVELISSHQWFDALEDLDTWEAKAWPDRPAQRV